MEPIRILHENVIMQQGGIENLIMNIYRNIDRNKIQFDFMVHREKKGFFDDEIKSMGGKIYVTPPFNPFHHHSYLNGIKSVLSEHPEYKIIHCHSELNMWPLRIAAKMNVPIRIAHSHSSKTPIDLKYFFMKYQQVFIKKYCTHMFMCSKEAGKWAFGEEAIKQDNAYVVKNGIDINKFVFNRKVREEVRKELNLNNKFVVGNVGRLVKPKNHSFLLNIFNEVLKRKKNAVLLLVGEGELETEIKNKVKVMGLEQNVIFTGLRADTERLYQCMDAFVLPSLWEGLPLVLVEAQAAGLPCFVSATVSGEAKLTKNINYLSLDDLELWANEICKTDTNKRDTELEKIEDAGFDIKKTADFLSEFYLMNTK